MEKDIYIKKMHILILIFTLHLCKNNHKIGTSKNNTNFIYSSIEGNA